MGVWELERAGWVDESVLTSGREAGWMGWWVVGQRLTHTGRADGHCFN